MKVPATFILLILFITLLSANSLTDDKFSDYKITDSGLKYKFHYKADGENAIVGKIITFEMLNKDEYGNILMDTRGEYPSVMELIESEYEGDIYEGLAMMSVGDSATFIVDARKFYSITAKISEDPSSMVEPGSKLFINVKMVNVQTEEEFEKELMEQIKRQAELNEIAFEEEQTKLNNYLEEHNISEKPQESGLIYIEIEKGDGPKVKQGQDVRVHYTGRFIDGTVFDSSLERGDPISFAVGQGQVIPGWDEGIMLMNVGGKARLIIPSHIAYGEQGAGNIIPPFSTLIFDVEVVEAN